jgi:hypothetical protein
MKFQQRTAGNAHRRPATRLGTSATLVIGPMRRPVLFLLMVLSLLLAAPAAQAGDPLLSGYAGPGSGEQVILGGGVVGGGGGGGSASKSTRTAAQSLSAAAAATANSSTSGSSSNPTRIAHRKSGSSSTSSSSKRRSKSGSTTSSSSSTSSSPTSAHSAGAPHVVPYPTRAGAVSSFPLSLSGALLVVLGLGLLVLGALGLRRIGSSRPQDGPSRPQVSVR